MVSGGELRLDWTYSTNVHAAATVERLAQSHLDQLRLLIAERHSDSAVSLTPSDFRSAGALSRKDLDKVLSRIKGPLTRP
jgi:non-ribosomal peptide synthase protein (TIGR01720 family)